MWTIVDILHVCILVTSSNCVLGVCKVCNENIGRLPKMVTYEFLAYTVVTWVKLMYIFASHATS